MTWDVKQQNKQNKIHKKMNRGGGGQVSSGDIFLHWILVIISEKMGLLILDISLTSSMLKAKLFNPLYTKKNENESFLSIYLIIFLTKTPSLILVIN